MEGNRLEKKMGKELVIRDGTRNDLSLILAFKERLGETGRTIAFYDWKYFQNNLTRSYVCLAEDNSQIVSTVCLTPARMKFGDKIITGFQIVDSFTLPSYRGKGVYSKVNRTLMAKAETEGVKLIYGVGSAMIHPMLIERFGFVSVRKMKRGGLQE